MNKQPKGTISLANIRLEEHKTTIPRLFVADSDGHLYPIYPGYDITTATTTGDGQRHYLSSMRLSPSKDNPLEKESYISFRKRYEMPHDDCLQEAGQLDPDEVRVFDVHRDIYQQRGFTETLPMDAMQRQLSDQKSLYDEIKQDNHQEVRRLLQNGVDPNPEGLENQPLHFAAICRASRSADELCEHGAHVHALNGNLKTALDLAIRNDDVATAETLLRYGADPDVSIAEEHVFAYSPSMKNLLARMTDNQTSTVELSMSSPAQVLARKR